MNSRSRNEIKQEISTREKEMNKYLENSEMFVDDKKLVAETAEKIDLVGTSEGTREVTKAMHDSGEIIKNEDLTIPGPESLSYAYCSDTRYFSRLASFVKRVNLLYHEATFNDSLADLARETGHSTTSDAARTAMEAGAGTLLIGHFSARYKDISLLLNEARSIFPRTLAAIDGTSYDVGNTDIP